MGVKQTTDVLEKGTWLFAAIVGILCLLSLAVIPKTGSGATSVTVDMKPQTQTVPKAVNPNPGAPTVPAHDTNK